MTEISPVGSEIIGQLGIEKRIDYFSPDMAARLVGLGLELPDRKTTFDLNENPDEVPLLLRCAATIVHEELGVRPDILVVKRYIPGEPSDAFVIHRDPEEYWGMDAAIWSGSGDATFSIVNVMTQSLPPCISTHCVPNSIVKFRACYLHVVTPPVAEHGPRVIVFFGQRNNMEPSVTITPQPF